MPDVGVGGLVAGAEQHDLAGAQRALDLGLDRQQPAEPLQQRPERRDVGPPDEAHRTTDRVADRERREHRGQREAAGVDDDQRAGRAPAGARRRRRRRPSAAG